MREIASRKFPILVRRLPISADLDGGVTALRNSGFDCAGIRALSSAGERSLHTGEVVGSIPTAPTIQPYGPAPSARAWQNASGHIRVNECPPSLARDSVYLFQSKTTLGWHAKNRQGEAHGSSYAQWRNA